MTTATTGTTETTEPLAPNGYRRAPKPRHFGAHLVLGILLIYFLVPFFWIIINASKNASGLFGGGNALWFAESIDYIGNLRELFTYNGGIYLRWIGNSAFYAITGGVGATVLAVLAGYGFAKFAFKGREFTFALLLGSVMVPLTALVIPTFIMLSQFHLTNTVWAVILPSLLNPFGVYLMRVYVQDSIPDELLDAARVDGASEFRTFRSVALPLLRPAVVTVLLLSIVGTWNNFFLPLAMMTDTNLLPITVGLNGWQAKSTAGAGGEQLWNLVTTGALISIIPLVISFLCLQRYWQGGLTLGAVK